VPARLVLEEIWRSPDLEEKRRRLEEVLDSFRDLEGALPEVIGPTEAAAGPRGAFVCALEAPLDAAEARGWASAGANVFDFTGRRAFLADAAGRRFLDHLETYGIRLEPDGG
jgi:hypothetical protein